MVQEVGEEDLLRCTFKDKGEGDELSSLNDILSLSSLVTIVPVSAGVLALQSST